MQQLQYNPFFQQLETVQRILIAGAGGGFDIYSGIPLYLSLKAQGKDVFLANFSFTWLNETDAEQVFPFCYKVKATAKDNSGRNYFPEKYLCEWFAQQNIDLEIFAFERTGVQPLKAAYNYLIDQLQLDAIILVDGGTDSLMFGDEEHLGTPQEDSCSLAAVYQSKVGTKLLASIGFGVDHFHGVSHYRFLENLASLIQSGGYLGSFHLLQEMEEGRLFSEAVAHVNQRMENYPSIVANSILSALNGEYGDYHRTGRTAGSELWINPLMTIYWCFYLDKVVEKIGYYEVIKNTHSIGELNYQLSAWRGELEKIRMNKQLPI